ncbi:MAG: hypothetical protein AAF385_01465 [Pseudomonadota bacterium]
MTRNIVFAALALSLTGCATLTSDAMTPVALSFSDGSNGTCQLSNKRGAWTAPIPATTMVRRSDDALRYQCRSDDGRQAEGQLESTVGAKIVASAVFIDLGITDAITDKHREYPASFVVPLRARTAGTPKQQSTHESVREDIMRVSVDDAVSESSDAMVEVGADSAPATPAETDTGIKGGLLGGTKVQSAGGMFGGQAKEPVEE